MTAPALYTPPQPLRTTPSPDALALAAGTKTHLERALMRGTTPAMEQLIGWEFRGINTPAWAKVAGIKKFMKGFYTDGAGQTFGYNCPVVQDALTAPWQTKPSNDAPKRFGFYTVTPTDPTARDNAYLHAVLLDYSRGDNAKLDPSQGLRDYLVQVSPDNPDLFLGKAYFAIGPARLGVSFFVLERDRRGIRELARR